jgi:GDP-4-dehydro-6-deoxy-D-mannose reductase
VTAEARSREGVILVTGAAGFAGGHLLAHLSGTGEILAWARSAPPDDLAALARWQRVDLLDRASVRAALAEAQPSQVYHLAGRPHVAQSWEHSSDALRDNVLATHVLLDELRHLGLGARVLLTGSATVYAPSDRPIDESGALAMASPYAVSKLAQETLVLRAPREDGLDVVVARAFNHTGARQTPAFAAPSFARQIALIERGVVEPTIRVGNLDAARDFTDVRDVVRAYALLMTHGKSSEVYNVASGTCHSMRSVLDLLVAQSRIRVTVEVDPARLRPSDTPVLMGDATKLRAATGWAPAITFDRMLHDLLGYWRQAA